MISLFKTSHRQSPGVARGLNVSATRWLLLLALALGALFPPAGIVMAAIVLVRAHRRDVALRPFPAPVPVPESAIDIPLRAINHLPKAIRVREPVDVIARQAAAHQTLGMRR